VSLVWTAEQWAAIRRHGEAGYPDEICGLLIGERAGGGGVDKLVREVAPVENTWEQLGERRRRFRISPETFMREERRARAAGREILGFYHSHPDDQPRPSETDREFAWPSYSYVILAVERGRARVANSWVLRDDRSGYEQEPIEEKNEV
jgi:proteasome lid subunit RPN8/RPN11